MNWGEYKVIVNPMTFHNKAGESAIIEVMTQAMREAYTPRWLVEVAFSQFLLHDNHPLLVVAKSDPHPTIKVRQLSYEEACEFLGRDE